MNIMRSCDLMNTTFVNVYNVQASEKLMEKLLPGVHFGHLATANMASQSASGANGKPHVLPLQHELEEN